MLAAWFQFVLYSDNSGIRLTYICIKCSSLLAVFTHKEANHLSDTYLQITCILPNLMQVTDYSKSLTLAIIHEIMQLCLFQVVGEKNSFLNLK